MFRNVCNTITNVFSGLVPCPGSSRTKRLWVRSCRTLSMTRRSVIDRWVPGGLQPPSHIARQQSWQIDSALLQLPSWTPQLHLSIPLWPHPDRCCSLIPPRGLFTFWLCVCVSICGHVFVLMNASAKTRKETETYVYVMMKCVNTQKALFVYSMNCIFK